MTTIQLQYIIAVDNYRHFVTAAEKCFVTQPTLSMQIKKLEDELGVMIFDRSKHPIIPTEIGEKILEQARIAVMAQNDINTIIDEFHGTITGELHLGIIPSLAPYLLPKFIGKITHKYPGIQLKVVELLSEDMITRLKKDQLDFGLLVTPLNDPTVIEKPLFYEKMLLYVNKNHKFSNKKAIQASEIASPDLWLLSKGHCFRSQVVNLCSYKSDLERHSHVSYESGSLETLKKLVDSEGGYTLIPELAIPIDSNDSSLVLPIIKPIPVREVSLIYTRNFAKQRLISIISEEIKNEIDPALLVNDKGKVVEWR